MFALSDPCAGLKGPCQATQDIPSTKNGCWGAAVSTHASFKFIDEQKGNVGVSMCMRMYNVGVSMCMRMYQAPDQI